MFRFSISLFRCVTSLALIIVTRSLTGEACLSHHQNSTNLQILRRQCCLSLTHCLVTPVGHWPPKSVWSPHGPSQSGHPGQSAFLSKVWSPQDILHDFIFCIDLHNLHFSVFFSASLDDYQSCYF